MSSNSAVPRRDFMRRSAALAAACAVPGRLPAASGELIDAVLATPGPTSSVSLIPELALRIGADRAEGLALRLKFVSGGGVAIREIFNGNAQFGVFGVPAAMHENLDQPRLAALCAIEDRVPLSVMVRADLKSQVRRVEDLRGRALGVTSNALTTLTTGQQFMILVLRQHGIAPEAVRFVAAGQSLESLASALRGKLVDAVVAEEPLSLMLGQDRLAFPVYTLGQPGQPGQPKDAQPLPGAGFLRGALICASALPDAQPLLAQRMVRVMQRALAWKRAHSPDEVVAALGLAGSQADAFAAMFRQYPGQFSADGKFSQGQLAQTEVFFRESAGQSPASMRYALDSMLVDRWVGRKP